MTVRPAPLCVVVICLALLGAAVCFAQPAPAPAAAAPATPAAAAAPNALPPHVVNCTPAAFAANVDVNLTQVSVTFDRPMNTAGGDGFAGLKWYAQSPVGRRALVTWNADGTVASLPVKLDTDMTYAITVNASAEAKARAGGAAKGVFADPSGATALPFTWAFSTGARTPADFPTYVVSSLPAQAAGDVDATTAQISVTFNRPIAAGDMPVVAVASCGVSPVAAGGGKGHGGGRRGRGAAAAAGPVSLSADRLTATIDVSLLPGTIYALSLNSDNREDWKDVDGRPVLPYAWCFKTTGTAPAATAAGPAPGAPAAAPAK